MEYRRGRITEEYRRWGRRTTMPFTSRKLPRAHTSWVLLGWDCAPWGSRAKENYSSFSGSSAMLFSPAAFFSQYLRTQACHHSSKASKIRASPPRAAFPFPSIANDAGYEDAIRPQRSAVGITAPAPNAPVPANPLQKLSSKAWVFIALICLLLSVGFTLFYVYRVQQRATPSTTRLNGAIVNPPSSWKDVRIYIDGQRVEGRIDEHGRFDFDVYGEKGETVRLKVYVGTQLEYDDYQELRGPVNLKLRGPDPQRSPEIIDRLENPSNLLVPVQCGFRSFDIFPHCCDVRLFYPRATKPALHCQATGEWLSSS